MNKQLFTRSQLALHNGQDKATIYVAFQGQVYDVTQSRLWRNGKHYQHWAGQDLTAELAEAPHNEQVFERFDCVGELQQ
ncbi:MAG: cytochrome b5 domain-containing protein [Aureispira sp.]